MSSHWACRERGVDAPGYRLLPKADLRSQISDFRRDPAKPQAFVCTAEIGYDAEKQALPSDLCGFLLCGFLLSGVPFSGSGQE
jgi:hypothetical protein